jgi:hypothetical protein
VTDLAGRFGTAEASRRALSAVVILSLGIPLLPQPAAGQPSLPDLSVSVTDISVSNSSPMEGEPVFINATVHIGAAARAEPATVELLVDGKLAGLKEAGIDPNYTVQNISFEWWTRSGRHNVTIFLDPASEVAESDEGNNIAGLELDVRARPRAVAGTDWPIVLSALFPVCCAAIAFYYLYRRSDP